MKIIIILALVVFPFFVSACTALRKACVIDYWTTCEQDDDCVDIHYACTGATFNKRYVDGVAKFYTDKNPTLNCTEPFLDGKKMYLLGLLLRGEKFHTR
jgi:hypothetical protein